MNKNIRKAKLTSDGERLVRILQQEYFMDRSAAIRLLQDGGTMLAVALLTRGRR